MSIKVSIIIPVYNVKRYIDLSINSILRQNYDNYEVILVNDGSNDGSKEICDEYAKKNSKIKVIHIENSGVSNARNVGINNASGDYILFLDGDDTLEECTLEFIDNNAKFDMIIGSFKSVNEKNNSVENYINSSSESNGKKLIIDYGLWKLKTRIGAFAIRLDIVKKNKVYFNITCKYGEDVEFINYCLVNSNIVKVTNVCFCNYIFRESSAINKVNFRRYDCYEARKRTLNYFKAKLNNEEYKNINDIYEGYLLPEAIIDTTELLCRDGINLIKIISFIKNKNYFQVINEDRFNSYTPENIKNKITSFVDSPIKYWIKEFLKYNYYCLRGFLGKIKRRVIN